MIISICSKNLSSKFVSLFKNSTRLKQFFRFLTASSKWRDKATSHKKQPRSQDLPLDSGLGRDLLAFLMCNLMHRPSVRKVGLRHGENSFDVDAIRKPSAHEQTEYQERKTKIKTWRWYRWTSCQISPGAYHLIGS